MWREFEMFVGGVERGCRCCELAELIEQVTCENTFSAVLANCEDECFSREAAEAHSDESLIVSDASETRVADAEVGVSSCALCK